MSNLKFLYQFRNCEFAFKCDADWFELDDTDNEKIKFCNMCMKQVHRCDTEDELLDTIKSNLCVAIYPPYEKVGETRTLMGSMRLRI